MAFNSLDGRLILFLARKWKEKGTRGPYRTSTIYRVHSEMPDDYIAGELFKMSTKGLINFTSDKSRFYLADKGVSQIRSFISIDQWNAVGI